ncbi:MAG: hypothetical protein ACP5SH_27115, partial [Syntrophobacteraceae bacterium]
QGAKIGHKTKSVLDALTFDEFYPDATYTITGFEDVGAQQHSTGANPYAAAALYYHFRTGGMSSILNIPSSYSELQVNEAFQEAIWHLIGDPNWNNYATQPDISTLETDFENQGRNYGWTSDQNVREIVYDGRCTNPGQPELTLVPEPCTFLLLGLFLLGMAVCRRRSNRGAAA